VRGYLHDNLDVHDIDKEEHIFYLVLVDLEEKVVDFEINKVHFVIEQYFWH